MFGGEDLEKAPHMSGRCYLNSAKVSMLLEYTVLILWFLFSMKSILVNLSSLCLILYSKECESKLISILLVVPSGCFGSKE